MTNLGVPMGAQRHHRDDADVVQREIERDELGAVRQLNDDAVLRLQSEANEPARQALRRSNQLVVGDPRVAVDDGNLLRLAARRALDHLGDGDAFPQTGLDVASSEFRRPRDAALSMGVGSSYSAGPIVSVMVPTPSIVPSSRSPGATGPTPSGVPV